MPGKFAAGSPARRIFVSSNCLAGGRDLSVALERLAAAGVFEVELSGGHGFADPDALLARLQAWRGRGMAFTVHNYFPPPREDFVLNIASFDPAVRAQNLRLMNQALDFAGQLQAPFYGVHAGYLADATESRGQFHFQAVDSNGVAACQRRAVDTVLEVLRERGDRLPPQGLLVENLFPPSTGPNHSLCTTPGELISFFEAVAKGGGSLGLLLDLAHLDLACRRYGRDSDAALEQLLEVFGERLRAVHLSGHDGLEDVHRPLRADDWQLRAVGRIARSRGAAPGPCFTLECRWVDEPTVLAQRELLRRALDEAEDAGDGHAAR